MKERFWVTAWILLVIAAVAVNLWEDWKMFLIGVAFMGSLMAIGVVSEIIDPRPHHEKEAEAQAARRREGFEA